MTRQKHRARARRRSGFTLIEVLISVALVLMLTYGIAQVFKMSTDTVGAQMSIGGFVRDHRAAVTTLTEDFRNCVNDSPLFLIDSQVAYDGISESVNGVASRRGFRAGFRNALEEMQSLDANKDPTRMVEGMPDPVPFNQYTDRTPRLDRLGFFARGMYRRQTAGLAQVFSPTSSTEAYIWYGHTAYPGSSSPLKGSPYPNGNFMTLPQNQYAQDRILGRLAILLGDTNSFTGGDSYLRSAANPVTPLAPLDYDTQVFNSNIVNANNGSFQAPSTAFYSLTDMAAVTIDQWRSYANTAYSGTPTALQPFLGPQGWYYPMNDSPPKPSGPNQRIWRALCQPTLQRPINSQKLAQTSSCFIPNCSQFIVEYAGDYLAQDPTTGRATDAKSKQDINTGVVTDGKTDGEIDYILETVSPGITVKRIRWYGLPRDTNGDGFINEVDVLPLGDVMDFYGIRSGSGGAALAPWEKVLPFPGLMAMQGHDYSNFRAPAFAAKDFKYICAWHNDAPPMIRISLKFSDPAGRLQDGQWYEYILTR